MQNAPRTSTAQFASSANCQSSECQAVAGPQAQVWVFTDQAKPILPSIIWGVKMECGNTLATISFLLPIIFNNVNAWFNLFPAL